MAKSKRARAKFHTSAVRPKKKNDGSKDATMEGVDMETEFKLPAVPAATGPSIFQGLNIDKAALTQKLPDFDTRSTITSKSLKELRLKKKDKQKMRHDLWVQKMNAIESAKQQAKDRKRKQQTPVVGDIGILGEALPTLELLLKGDTGPHKPRGEETKPKARSVPKAKQRRKQMMQDISIFQQVLEHPAYRENPTATISEHLRNKLQQEDVEG